MPRVQAAEAASDWTAAHGETMRLARRQLQASAAVVWLPLHRCRVLCSPPLHLLPLTSSPAQFLPQAIECARESLSVFSSPTGIASESSGSNLSYASNTTCK